MIDVAAMTSHWMGLTLSLEGPKVAQPQSEGRALAMPGRLRIAVQGGWNVLCLERGCLLWCAMIFRGELGLTMLACLFVD